MVNLFRITFLRVRLTVILSRRNARGDSSANAYVKEGYLEMHMQPEMSTLQYKYLVY